MTLVTGVSAVQVFLNTERFTDTIKCLKEGLFLKPGSLILHENKINLKCN